MHHARSAAAQPLPVAAGAAPRLDPRRCPPPMALVRGAAVRSGMVLSCVKPGSAEPSNKGMKQTKLVAAPVQRTAVPPRAFRRFAAVRTASQLIPGVVRTRWRWAMNALLAVAFAI